MADRVVVSDGGMDLRIRDAQPEDKPESCDVLLTADNCRILWREFKTHSFRQDEVDGMLAATIMRTVFKLAHDCGEE